MMISASWGPWYVTHLGSPAPALWIDQALFSSSSSSSSLFFLFLVTKEHDQALSRREESIARGTCGEGTR
jgi:hypothetical protein